MVVKERIFVFVTAKVTSDPVVIICLVAKGSLRNVISSSKGSIEQPLMKDSSCDISERSSSIGKG